MPKLRKISAREYDETPELPDPDSREESSTSPQTPGSIDQRYPYLSAWVTGGGWIEIGANEYSTSFVRILDIGGMLWEGDDDYPSLDAAFEAAEAALVQLEVDGWL